MNEMLIFGALNVYVILSILSDPYPLLKRKEHVKGHAFREQNRKNNGREKEKLQVGGGSYVTKSKPKGEMKQKK